MIRALDIVTLSGQGVRRQSSDLDVVFDENDPWDARRLKRDRRPHGRVEETLRLP
jgi:hypothetical protein